ncbi:MAG: hypothetical protein WDZ58_06170 [Gemmatimonadaceae bacterium]
MHSDKVIPTDFMDRHIFRHYYGADRITTSIENNHWVARTLILFKQLNANLAIDRGAQSG